MNKQRFPFLDGMRGIAALMVACLHAGIDFNLRDLPSHGYLAVDFFFCLSGFVVSHAYDSRIRSSMAFSAFAARRLIRLYPMIFISALLGAIIYFVGGFGANATISETILLAASIFVILPFGLLFHLQAFPINGPVWSLFFEFAASAAYFFDASSSSLGLRRYALYLACFGVALALLIQSVGSADAVGFASPLSFAAGFVRVSYSFLAGILICRFGLARRLPAISAALPAAGLLLLLCLPTMRYQSIYDSACILLAFPLLVALGAQVPAGSQCTRLWEILGRFSYPLYVLHQPVLRAAYRLSQNSARLRAHPSLLASASLLFAILLSYTLLILYDEPLRRALSRPRPRPRPAPAT